MTVQTFAREVISSGFCAFRVESVLIEEVFVEWQRSILEPLGATIEKQQLIDTPERLIAALRPLVAPIKTKHLYIDIGRGWVLVVDNSRRGTDAALAPVLSKKCDCLGIRVVSQSDTFDSERRSGRYGAQIFECYSSGVSVRTLFCANDGGKWKFGQTGTPFAVEKVSSYSFKNIKARFTNSDVLRLIEFLGLNPFEQFDIHSDDAVPGTLFSRVGALPENYSEYSEY